MTFLRQNYLEQVPGVETQVSSQPILIDSPSLALHFALVPQETNTGIKHLSILGQGRCGASACRN